MPKVLKHIDTTELYGRHGIRKVDNEEFAIKTKCRPFINENAGKRYSEVSVPACHIRGTVTAVHHTDRVYKFRVSCPGLYEFLMGVFPEAVFRTDEPDTLECITGDPAVIYYIDKEALFSACLYLKRGPGVNLEMKNAYVYSFDAMLSTGNKLIVNPTLGDLPVFHMDEEDIEYDKDKDEVRLNNISHHDLALISLKYLHIIASSVEKTKYKLIGFDKCEADEDEDLDENTIIIRYTVLTSGFAVATVIFRG